MVGFKKGKLSKELMERLENNPIAKFLGLGLVAWLHKNELIKITDISKIKLVNEYFNLIDIPNLSKMKDDMKEFIELIEEIKKERGF